MAQNALYNVKYSLNQNLCNLLNFDDLKNSLSKNVYF